MRYSKSPIPFDGTRGEGSRSFPSCFAPLPSEIWSPHPHPTDNKSPAPSPPRQVRHASCERRAAAPARTGSSIELAALLVFARRNHSALSVQSVSVVKLRRRSLTPESAKSDVSSDKSPSGGGGGQGRRHRTEPREQHCLTRIACASRA